MTLPICPLCDQMLDIVKEIDDVMADLRREGQDREDVLASAAHLEKLNRLLGIFVNHHNFNEEDVIHLNPDGSRIN